MIVPIRGTPHKETRLTSATEGCRALLGAVQETRWPALCLSVRGSGGACVRTFSCLAACRTALFLLSPPLSV